MAVNKHEVAVLDSANQAGGFTDRVVAAQQLGVANAAGSGAGASVSTVVTFAEALPPSYTVVIQSYQDAVGYVTAKTAFGFTVVLNPRLAANTLAAGAFDATVMAL